MLSGRRVEGRLEAGWPPQRVWQYGGPMGRRRFQVSPRPRRQAWDQRNNALRSKEGLARGSGTGGRSQCVAMSRCIAQRSWDLNQRHYGNLWLPLRLGPVSTGSSHIAVLRGVDRPSRCCLDLAWKYPTVYMVMVSGTASNRWNKQT